MNTKDLWSITVAVLQGTGPRRFPCPLPCFAWSRHSEFKKSLVSRIHSIKNSVLPSFWSFKHSFIQVFKAFLFEAIHAFIHSSIQYLLFSSYSNIHSFNYSSSFSFGFLTFLIHAIDHSFIHIYGIDNIDNLDHMFTAIEDVEWSLGRPRSL